MNTLNKNSAPLFLAAGVYLQTQFAPISLPPVQSNPIDETEALITYTSREGIRHKIIGKGRLTTGEGKEGYLYGEFPHVDYFNKAQLMPTGATISFSRLDHTVSEQNEKLLIDACEVFNTRSSAQIRASIKQAWGEGNFAQQKLVPLNQFDSFKMDYCK